MRGSSGWLGWASSTRGHGSPKRRSTATGAPGHCETRLQRRSSLHRPARSGPTEPNASVRPAGLRCENLPSCTRPGELSWADSVPETVVRHASAPAGLVKAVYNSRTVVSASGPGHVPGGGRTTPRRRSGAVPSHGNPGHAAPSARQSGRDVEAIDGRGLGHDRCRLLAVRTKANTSTTAPWPVLLPGVAAHFSFARWRQVASVNQTGRCWRRSRSYARDAWACWSSP